MDKYCRDKIGKELLKSFFKFSPKNSDKNGHDAVILCYSDENDVTEDAKIWPFHGGTLSSFFSEFSSKSWQEMSKINTSKDTGSRRKKIDISLSGIQESSWDVPETCINKKLWRFRDHVNVVADPHLKVGHFLPLSSVIDPNSRLFFGLNGIQSSRNDATSQSLDKEGESRNLTIGASKHFVRQFLSVFLAPFAKSVPWTVDCDDYRKIQAKNGNVERVGGSFLPLVLAKIGCGSQNVPVFARLQAEPNSSLSEVLRSQSAKISTIMKLPELSATMSITGLMDLIPHGGNLQQAFPDKRELSSVQEFYQYAELEGKRLFQELDRDRDGLATLSDIEEATRRRKLPLFFASEFLSCAKKHWLSRSFGWDEFSSVIREKEPKMLSAFNSVRLCKSGTIQKSELKALLQNARLPATEEHVTAMLEFLDSGKDGSISYSQFRKFMLFVPTHHIVNDPWTIWFKAATLMSPTMMLQTVPKINTRVSEAVKSSSLPSCVHDISKVGILVSSLSLMNPLLKLSHVVARMWKMRQFKRLHQY